MIARRAADAGILWPSPRYRKDPVGYAKNVLGVEPWEKQVEILEAVRDHKRVAIRSGHKVSKSHSLAIAALWFFSSFDDARVVCTCVTARQVDEIFYRECKKLHSQAGQCIDCRRESVRRQASGQSPLPKPCAHSAMVDGEPKMLARSGIKSVDFREIVGFTAKEAEAVAGISGKNILYLIDEASGVDDEIFEAIEGNSAGGARIVMTSNPTRCEGKFFEAFQPNSVWKQIHISSADSPNVKAGREVIPGLAGPEWIELMKREYGADSPIFKVRVEGDFVRNEEGKIVSLHAIELAEQLWEETEATGRLHIGVDPAGKGGDGDESAFATRRGDKVLSLIAMRGLTAEAHVSHILRTLASNAQKRDVRPVVAVDADGVGSEIVGLLRAHLELHPDAFELLAVKSSGWATKQPLVYERVRDELWASFRKWLDEGGALPSDSKLAQELHAPMWTTNVRSKWTATSKPELRKMLGRSPDRADAVILSVWEPSILRPDVQTSTAEETPSADWAVVDSHDAGTVFDPYGGAG